MNNHQVGVNRHQFYNNPKYAEQKKYEDVHTLLNNELKNQGVTIYHINGIRNLICFDNERTDLESKI